MAKKKSSSSASVNQLASSLLSKRFARQSVAIVGRYSYYPSKEQLKDFITSQGGKIVDKIDTNLDVLFVGEGKKTAKQTKAEKLVSSGDAEIEIIEDLAHLYPGFQADLMKFLSDEESISLLRPFLSNYGWLNEHIGCNFKQEDFSGYTIGSKDLVESKSNESKQLPIFFESCIFTKAKFLNVEFGSCYRYGTTFSDCQFDQTQFNGTRISNAEKCHFVKTKGKHLEIDEVSSCQFLDMKIDVLRLGELEDSKLENCLIKKFSLDGYREELKKTEFQNCQIKSFEADEWSPNQVKFTDCQISDLTCDSMDVENSKFRNLLIKKGKIGSLAFKKCELTDCCFTNLQCDTLVISDCNVKDVEFKRCKIETVIASEDQVKDIKGLSDSEIKDFSNCDRFTELVDVMKQSDKVEFFIDGVFDQGNPIQINARKEWSWSFEYEGKGSYQEHKGDKNLYSKHYNSPPTATDIHFHFQWLIQSSRIEDFDPGTLRIKTSKCPLKPKELKSLVTDALYQLLGKTPPTEEELKEASAKARKQKSGAKAEILEELKSGNAEALNKRTKKQLSESGPYRNLDLGGVNLAGLSASKVNFGATDLSKSNLSGADLSEGSFFKTNFTSANLSRVNLRNANLKEADLSKADLSGAAMYLCQLKDANLNSTNLQGANFCDEKKGWGTDLDGVDLSRAKMKSAVLKNCSYDEKTKLPKSLTKTQLKSMYWSGGGLPPHERKQNIQVTGPLDFPVFMERLTEITDPSRLKKALKMLKADSFKLFSEVSDEAVYGVVKSQSDDSLVYSCSIDSEGGFACCTQNLNPCGGLRGAICKHILVLIVGLTKDDQLDAACVDRWVNDSKLKSPELDKDRMSEVLLKHKGAEAGEIDWRPTETVPEDFMAF